jgi:general secretion pathway protein K
VHGMKREEGFTAEHAETAERIDGTTFPRRVLCALRGAFPRTKGGRGERGIALLVVLSTLALVASVVADFQYNASVDLQLALNARDELQAEYNALSALRLRALLLKNARVVTQALTSMSSTFGIDSSLMPPAGQLLEMIPVECGLMSAITKKSGADEDEASGDFFPGDCEATSKSEHAKISLSVLRNASGAQAQRVQQVLLGFLSDPKLHRYFEKDDKSGDHAEKPEELVGSIADWIDDNTSTYDNQAGDEDRHYQYLRDSYRAKNAPFDSVAELQLVHGINDDLYNVLKDRVTIYNSTPEMELGTADDISIALGLCSISTAGCDWLVQPAFWTALKAIRELGGATFAPMNLATLTAVIQTSGIPVDVSRLTQVFSDKNSTTWYTIDAQGELGNAKRHIRAVFQTQEGHFYYFRVE